MIRTIIRSILHLDARQRGSSPKDTCSGCEYLAYNSDGGVECPMEYKHKCRPETRVMYKRSHDEI